MGSGTFQLRQYLALALGNVLWHQMSSMHIVLLAILRNKYSQLVATCTYLLWVKLLIWHTKQNHVQICLQQSTSTVQQTEQSIPLMPWMDRFARTHIQHMCREGKWSKREAVAAYDALAFACGVASATWKWIASTPEAPLLVRMWRPWHRA